MLWYIRKIISIYTNIITVIFKNGCIGIPRLLGGSQSNGHNANYKYDDLKKKHNTFSLYTINICCIRNIPLPFSSWLQLRFVLKMGTMCLAFIRSSLDIYHYSVMGASSFRFCMRLGFTYHIYLWSVYIFFIIFSLNVFLECLRQGRGLWSLTRTFN